MGALGAKWRALSDAERAPYEAEAASLKAAWKANMAAWTALHPNGPPPEPKRVGLPAGVDAGALTPEQVLAMVALPRALGVHPQSKGAVPSWSLKIGLKGTVSAAHVLPAYNVVLNSIHQLPGRVIDASLRLCYPCYTESFCHSFAGEVLLCQGPFGLYARSGDILASFGKDVGTRPDGPSRARPSAVVTLSRGNEVAPRSHPRGERHHKRE